MDQVTTEQILDAGLADWRKLAQALHARFLTKNFAMGQTSSTRSVRQLNGPTTIRT